MEQLTFRRGPFGEIFPLPLIAGEKGEDLLAELAHDAEAAGNPLQRIPVQGASREGMERLAASYVHGKRLAAALDGKMDAPEARGLHLLVVERGEGMSLRPLMAEHLAHFTFAPVFRRVGEKWQVGLEGHGRTQVIEGPAGEALQQAQVLYRQWAEEEEELLRRRAREEPRSLTGDYYALFLQVLTPGELMPLPNGWMIQRGRHDIWTVYMGDIGMRFIEAAESVVARALLLLADSTGNPVPCPDPTLFLELAAHAEPRLAAPLSTGGARLWRAGDWEFRWLASQMPRAGRWGLIRRKELDIGELRCQGALVQLYASQPPLSGLVAEWDSSDFRALGERRDMGAVVPLLWAAWELLQAVDRRLKGGR